MKQDKIINRIKNLLEMGERSEGNEHEAAIAMKRAYKLMAKYNVDRASLSDKDDVEEFGKDFFIRKRGGPWARSICLGIAKLYMCHYYYRPDKQRTDTHFFVGTESNIHIAKMVSNFVMDVIDNEAKRTAYATATESKTQYLNSFRNAASARIYQRCLDLISEAEHGNMTDETGNTLPVLASVYDQHRRRAQEFMNRDGVKLRPSKGLHRSTSSSGFSSGLSAGNNVNLRPSLS